MDDCMDQTSEALHGNGGCDGVGVTTWLSVCPRGLWKVQQKQAGKKTQHMVYKSGDDASCSTSDCPRLGSLCQVRVSLKADTEEGDSLVSVKRNENLTCQSGITEATVFPRCLDSVLQVPLGEWMTLRLGEGQCDVTEACLERMRAGEKCEILVSPDGNGSDFPVPHPAEETLPLCATVELKAFTPGKESWEMSLGEKWEWVKSHKEKGGVRFRSGDVWGAADSYSRALKLLIALHGLVGEADRPKEGVEEHRNSNPGETIHCLPFMNEFKSTKAELHSNLSLCQLKLNQPERARASASKATQLDPGGIKAWYRLGQACQMLNELEEARQAFKKLLELQPESSAAVKALKNIASREKATNAQLGLRLSKMFS